MRFTLPQVSHITRKGGVFYYRRRFPGRPSGEVAISLHTSHFREAEHRAGLLDRAFGKAWERAVADESAGATLGAVLRDYLKEALDRDLERRFQRPPGEAVYAHWWEPGDTISAAEADLQVIRERRAALAHDVAQNRPDDLAEETATELLARYGLPANLRHRLVMGMLEATIRSLDTAERRTLGLEQLVFSEAPALPVEPAQQRSTPEPPKAPTKPLVSSLLEEHFARRLAMGNMLQQVIGQERTTLKHFMAICGDRPVDTYQRGDVTTFLDTLRWLPAVYGRSPKDKHKSLAEIIAEADAKGAERVKERTVKRHSSALAQFFRFAMDQGHIPNADRVGLVKDHRFAKGARSAKEQRDAWTSEDLTALFRSPVWTGRHATRPTQPGPHIIKDAKYWLPLLALYHGARLEEFADMRRKDIGQEDGIWFARISDEERRLKTDNSRRVIPLHQEVLRLGFIQYVQEKAPSPDAPLFPDLEPQGPDGKRGPRFTRDFGHYRRAVGLYRPGVGMHAFRHTANTRLRDVIQGYQQERHVAYLLGHSQGGGEGRERYDKGPGLEAVAETMTLLTYPELLHLSQKTN